MENAEAKPNPAIEAAEITATKLSILLEAVDTTTYNSSALKVAEKTADSAASELTSAIEDARKTPSEDSAILEASEKTAERAESELSKALEAVDNTTSKL